MSLLLVGIAIGIPVGIILKMWLDALAETMTHDGWR